MPQQSVMRSAFRRWEPMRKTLIPAFILGLASSLALAQARPYPGPDVQQLWLGAVSTREALAAALAEMVSSGEITDAKAIEMAHAYLHDTAVSLYPSLGH